MTKVDEIIEEYSKTRIETRRLRFPKLDLHDTFKRILIAQINKLMSSGLSDVKIIERMQKAIPFFVKEIRDTQQDQVAKDEQEEQTAQEDL